MGRGERRHQIRCASTPAREATAAAAVCSRSDATSLAGGSGVGGHTRAVRCCCCCGEKSCVSFTVRTFFFWPPAADPSSGSATPQTRKRVSAVCTGCSSHITADGLMRTLASSCRTVLGGDSDRSRLDWDWIGLLWLLKRVTAPFVVPVTDDIYLWRGAVCALDTVSS